MKAKFIGIASMLALLAACDQDKYLSLIHI